MRETAPATRLAAAVRAFRTGDLAAVREHCEKILAARPEHGEARKLLGMALLRGGDAPAARVELERALALCPREPELLKALAAAAARSGGAARAAELLAMLDGRAGEPPGAAGAVPPSLAALVGLASRLALEEDQGEAAEGLLAAALEGSAESGPGAAEAWSLRAWIAEQRNDDGKAGRYADAALARDPENFRARFVRARIADKAGQEDAASRAYETARELARAPREVALVHGRLGQQADRARRPAEAFEHFRLGNEALRPEAAGLSGTSVYGPPAIHALDRCLTAERLERWAREAVVETPTDDPAAVTAPVFLVGFPRSGTTLLDRVLSVHPAIHVLEERNTLGPLLRPYAGREASLAQLDAVDDRIRAAAAARYRTRLAREGAPADAIVVDKLPLNSVYLALIHRLLPDARILFALRDPRDVCLSCFAQAFGLNEAMAQFLDWNATARYYDAVMRVATRALDALPLRHVALRYEALVADLRGTLVPALELLGVDWHAGLETFHQAAGGGRINTPSYDQVRRPLHQEAVARWRRYPDQVAAVAPWLDPWVQRFAYPLIDPPGAPRVDSEAGPESYPGSDAGDPAGGTTGGRV